MFQESSQRPTFTILHEQVDLITMHFNTVVLNDVWMVQHFQHGHFFLDRWNNVFETARVLKFDFLNSQNSTGVQVDSRETDDNPVEQSIGLDKFLVDSGDAGTMLNEGHSIANNAQEFRLDVSQVPR
ncbi:hypothetical protein WICPIJ_003931 [Wickerhamomyces pijperi]|uniref:Uncharacterized protein n=1 Tax=Wickerhamomyces pijperi TaxID=599730 RepID=A0A9P8Q685_WICPI|nr:hypothetical protein WICPIJ_003931 [Wickerhamomyces pijperi]